MTSFYTIFHGNLAFSAVEEENLPQVIDTCYFPLLQLIETTKIKTGLELSAYSLEKIAHYRPLWIDKFKALHQQGLIELVGSGYMQIIGPLVPYQVNLKNQQLGLAVYQTILGITPTLAYVNEQAFSSSMIDVYQKVGYQAIAMEWNNAYSLHPTWPKSHAFAPCITQGNNTTLPILWTDSIVFQQFQRCIHGEYSKQEYLQQIAHHLNLGYQALPIYSSDLEIFNYRPGRFETETLLEDDEWKNTTETLSALAKMRAFLLPSEIIKDHLNQQITLKLVNASFPIIVKKQQKYSLSRWAACGRGAAYINNLCYRFFTQIKDDDNKQLWKLLLQYWGSDYRTHITPKKWLNAINYLRQFEIPDAIFRDSHLPLKEFQLTHLSNSIVIEKDNYQLIFLHNKGLCLDSIIIKGKVLPIGTVRHGELDFIHHGADFYTGTTVIDSAEHGRVTDLNKVENISYQEQGNELTIQAIIALKNIGHINKQWHIDLSSKKLTFHVQIVLLKHIRGSIRSGTLTLKTRPKNESFWYQSHNGGRIPERYHVDEHTIIDHAQPQSLIQSSKGGLGVSDGCLDFGRDNKKILSLQIDKMQCAPFVMLQNSVDNNMFLTRVFFSLQELDDTLKEDNQTEFHLKYSISLQ